ncbi:MAG: N-acetylmuramic acid 6-phosphate etherase [Acidobacteriota bacterium]
MAYPLTEHSNPRSRDLDLLSTKDLLGVMTAADAEVAALVAAQTPAIAAAVDAIAAKLEAGGRLFYVGAGTSGRLGVLDAAECPPTFGVPPTLVQGLIAGGAKALSTSVEGAEDNAAKGSQMLRGADVTAKDAVVGIAASGGTPFVRGAMNGAKEIGALTACVVCVPDSAIAGQVQFPIEVLTGAEILTGSTRLRAGTATKLVLNMISTAVMVKLGHVYGNLMVNVQPTNRKLEDRARRIIQAVAGTTNGRAEELFEISGRNVRLAIIMEKKGLSRDAAEELLGSVNGRLRAALEK